MTLNENIIKIGGVFMANKELKNRRVIGSAIDIKLHDSLKELSKITGVPISRLLDEAIEDLLKKRTSD